MKILVTGGAGFIGSHLCEALIARGDTVICVDDFNDFYDPSIKENNVSRIKDNANFKLYRADIRNRVNMKKIFAAEKPDKIVHLAARAGVRPSISDPLLYEDVNVKGTLNLLELARTNGIKQFIFGSSSSVYGITKVPFTEDDPGNPISPYAATKRAGEHLCHVYSHLYNIPITCLRFFTVYGPRQRPDLVIHKFTKAILNEKEIEVFGDGTSSRDYTFVSDIVRGILLTLEKPFNFEIINLGNNCPIQLNNLISIIEKATGKKAKKKTLPVQPGDVPTTYADISKAKKLLGWKPETDINAGLKQFTGWIRNNN